MKETSDGLSANYYKLPKDAKELQDLISFKNMNAQVGEAFRSLYRYGQCSHSSKEREIKKVLYYCQRELERLNKYEKVVIEEHLNLQLECPEGLEEVYNKGPNINPHLETVRWKANFSNPHSSSGRL